MLSLLTRIPVDEAWRWTRDVNQVGEESGEAKKLGGGKGKREKKERCGGSFLGKKIGKKHIVM